MSWIRKRKKFSRPRKPYEKVRIEGEAEIIKKYGLKSKREIWKAQAEIKRIRDMAKSLITASDKEKEKFYKKLNKIGFKIEKIADALALTTEDWLNRRLQTVVYTKGLAKTPKQARQFIVHKNVKVGNGIINIPSYIVKTVEEQKIEVIPSKKPLESRKTVEEVKNE